MPVAVSGERFERLGGRGEWWFAGRGLGGKFGPKEVFSKWCKGFPRHVRAGWGAVIPGSLRAARGYHPG